MSDLNPAEIYEMYRSEKLDAAATVDYLKTIIESGSTADSLVRSVELLGKFELNKPEDFKFLENLVTSEINEKVRLVSVRILIDKYLEEGEDLLKWVFINEKSADCLLDIYNALVTCVSRFAKDLLHTMEETVGMKNLIQYDLFPKESMALELLCRHLGNVYIFAELDKWYLENLKIEHQEVISIEIENLHSSIDSKFFSLFSGLQELILYDCKLNDAYFLGGITRLRIEGMEQGPLGSLDEIEGFENLINLSYLVNNSPFLSFF